MITGWPNLQSDRNGIWVNQLYKLSERNRQPETKNQLGHSISRYFTDKKRALVFPNLNDIKVANKLTI